MSRTGSHPSRRWTGTRPIDGRPTAPSLPATVSGPPAVGTSVFPTAHHEPGYCMKREFFGRNAAFRGAYSRQGLDGDGLGGRFGAIEMVAGGRFRAAAAPSGALGATRPDPPPHPHNPPSGLIRAVAPSVATPLPPPPTPCPIVPASAPEQGTAQGLHRSFVPFNIPLPFTHFPTPPTAPSTSLPSGSSSYWKRLTCSAGVFVGDRPDLPRMTPCANS